MRNFKKVLFVILALLPLISVLANCLQVDATDAFYIPLGNVEIVDNQFVIEEDSWADRILTPLGVNKEIKQGYWHATVGLLVMLETTVGFPMSFPIVLLAWYSMYMFIVIIVMLIFEFLTLIFRQCGLLS